MISPVALRDAPGPPRTTRLAPSPTGALHLGNARTFLINWALARRLGWRIILRIEDLDTPRTKVGADQQAIDDLTWLGMDWDEGPHVQAADLGPYARALESLHQRQLIYPCACTRRQILDALSAPQQGTHETRYPGTCRPTPAHPPTPGGTGGLSASEMGGEAALSLTEPFESPPPPTPQAPCAHLMANEIAWRLIVPEGEITFHDELAGPQRFDVQSQVGDFVVASKAGLPAYQLAVVVDDARQGVTDVVRGDDLLGSTARQLLLYRMLGLPAPAHWWHLPLVVGEDGRRLAKRHGDTRLATCRERGVPPDRVVGLLAHWSGLTGEPQPMSATEFANRLDLARLPRQEVVFTAGQERWLWR